MTVVGGRDQPFHPFRSPIDPGIYVWKIIPGGLVDAVKSIAVGDRISEVNRRIKNSNLLFI